MEELQGVANFLTFMEVLYGIKQAVYMLSAAVCSVAVASLLRLWRDVRKGN